MEIKGYIIEKEISRGPLTTLYLATQQALDRPVLLKILNVQWNNESDLVERFRREAKILARLRHPNVVTIFDFGVSGNTFYLVSEFIEGQDLKAYIKENQQLPFSTVLSITSQILQGLAYAHRCGVIHRDIKPSNILIGKDGSVKIADFGLATLSGLPSLTNQDVTVGTPAYMAPEQARAKKTDQRADLFSLGATIYEMLTGASPFFNENWAASLEKVLHHQPEPLRTVRPDVPAWFEELVNALLKKEPQERPESAEEILKLPHFKQAIPIRTNAPAPSTTGSTLPEDAAPEKTGNRSAQIKKVGIPAAAFILVIAVLASFYLGKKPAGPPPSQPIVAQDTQKTASANNDILQTGNDMTEQAAAAQKEAGNIKKPEVNDIHESASLKPQPSISSNDSASAAGQINAQQATMVVPVQPGSLMVVCYPWAEIYIGGHFRELTPLSEAIRLPAGTQQVELRNPNYQSYATEVVIKPGQTDTLTVQLQPAMGYLDLRVSPWAKVYIDNNYLETTPLPKPIPVAAGQHIVRLENPRFKTMLDTIIIHPQETLLREFNLRN